MHIEDLFTPTQQALVADLHRRDQQERQAGSTDPLRLKAVSPEVAHYLCLTADPPTGPDLGRIRHFARLFHLASRRRGSAHWGSRI